MAAFGVQRGGFLGTLNYTYEAIFFISICLKFLYEYKIEDAEQPPVRDISKIGIRYLKGEFIYDFIPFIPLPEINMGGYERLFYLIKIMRLVNGFKVFSVPAIMEKINYFARKKLEDMIENDPVEAENTLKDNNKISSLIILKFLIQIFKLIIIILNISYFLGFLWFIYCDLTMEFLYSGDENESGTFMSHFKIHLNSNIRNAIIVTYFSFTSLSTVGFGDFHPRSNAERIFCAFILLFGVAIFSYIMGIFI